MWGGYFFMFGLLNKTLKIGKSDGESNMVALEFWGVKLMTHNNKKT